MNGIDFINTGRERHNGAAARDASSMWSSSVCALSVPWHSGILICGPFSTRATWGWVACCWATASACLRPLLTFWVRCKTNSCLLYKEALQHSCKRAGLSQLTTGQFASMLSIDWWIASSASFCLLRDTSTINASATYATGWQKRKIRNVCAVAVLHLNKHGRIATCPNMKCVEFKSYERVSLSQCVRY